MIDVHRAFACTMRFREPHSNNPERAAMQRVVKSVFVQHSAQRMVELVERVESYPKFLPWCAGARVLEAHDGGKTARGSVAE